ncbi:hypothetical protein KCU95_g18622, partial [Aureobasidium melanogenum]
MADPLSPTMTVTIAIPVLANICQSVRDLEMEVHNLRTDFSTRLEALETQLARQQTTRPPSDVITDLPQNIADDTNLEHAILGNQEGNRVDEEDLHVQMDGRFHENGPAHTHEDNVNHTLEDDVSHTHEDGEGLAHEHGQGDVNSSSPSIDEGITGVAKPVISPPPAGAAGGKKRKRTIHDAPAYINRSGSKIRSSDAKLAGKRNGEARGPSRSESPFDNDDRDELSDGLDQIPPKPPIRPQSPSSSKPRVRPRRPGAEEAGLDRFVAHKPGDFTRSRTGRILKQTQRQSGFVATPADFE